MNRPTDSESSEMEAYWSRVHSLDRKGGIDELSIVTHHDLPRYVNLFYDRFERRAVERAWRTVPLPDRGRCLEIGPGRGRWTRRLLARGMDVFGIDISERAVEILRRNFPDGVFEVGSASGVPLPSASVDLVISVVVLLHLPPDERRGAFGEIARVLKPRGHVLLIESTHVGDPAPHVFPLSSAQWVAAFREEGLDCVYQRGQEYAPVIRGLEWLQAVAARWRRIRQAGDRRSFSAGPARIAERGARSHLLRVPVVALSHLLEPAAERFLPRRWARHGLFVFRKGEG